jgi:spore coat protein CotF
MPFGAHETMEAHEALNEKINLINHFNMYMEQAQNQRLREMIRHHLNSAIQVYEQMVAYTHDYSAGSRQIGYGMPNVQPEHIQYGLNDPSQMSPRMQTRLSDEQIAAAVLLCHKNSAKNSMAAAMECADPNLRQMMINASLICANQAYETFLFMNQHGQYQVPTMQEHTAKTFLHSYQPMQSSGSGMQSGGMHFAGNQTNGMQSGGAYADGTLYGGAQSFGMQNGGMQNGGMQNGGMQSGGMQSGGMQNGSMQSGSMQNGSMLSANAPFGNSQSGGLQSAGMQANGLQSTGMQSGGNQAGSMQPAGAQSGGNQPESMQTGMIPGSASALQANVSQNNAAQEASNSAYGKQQSGGGNAAASDMAGMNIGGGNIHGVQ